MIRYPGSKAKLVNQIVRHFPNEIALQLWAQRAGWEYREPFFGSGAIGLDVLTELPHNAKAWINDRDLWLASYWAAVRDQPKELCEKVMRFVPNPGDFYAWKKIDGAKEVDPVEAGFRKLALHQMSFSGLGSMAGGPLGGKNQDNGKYNIECRWSPEYQIEEIWRIHRLFGQRKLKVTSRDFSTMFDGTRNVFYYCDPPYVEKGPQLYRHSFTEKDHVRLAEILKKSSCRWIVSYDDHAMIRDLYRGYKIIKVDARYSVAIESVSRRKNSEILITHEIAA